MEAIKNDYTFLSSLSHLLMSNDNVTSILQEVTRVLGDIGETFKKRFGQEAFLQLVGRSLHDLNKCVLRMIVDLYKEQIDDFKAQFLSSFPKGYNKLSRRAKRSAKKAYLNDKMRSIQQQIPVHDSYIKHMFDVSLCK